MIRPTRSALAVAGAGVPLSLLPALLSPRLWPLWAVALLLFLLALGLDVLLAPRGLRVSAEAPPLLHVGRTETLALALALPRGRSLELVLDLDPLLEPVPARRLTLVDGRAVERIPLRALRRGPTQPPELWARWTGPFGLMFREERRALPLAPVVTPDTTEVREVALRFAGSPLIQQGVKLERRRGECTEFESLREFVPGMDMRALDWKSSARHRKLMAREHRAERNHQLIVAVDAGHAMSVPLESVARLDHAVRAALVLAWVALRSGDRVGVFGFDARVRCWAEPLGGGRAFPRAQQALASLPYSGEETNYTLGMAELSARVRRRSLVVLFTDVSDSTSAELMLENLDRLRARHLVLFVTLRDPGLDALAGTVPAAASDLHRSVIAAELRSDRELVLRRLRRLGIQVLDARPSDASPQLIARYLDVKRREMV
jgi:uncharacterized protein (DUF58 family)